MTARIGVLGGGRMGAGIAHAFLMAGCDVTVVERDAPSADAAAARVADALARSASRGAPAPASAALRTATDLTVFRDCELVVEAVPEDRDLKTDALKRVEAVLGPEAVLATNTSSISIDALAVALSRPERFLGLHFFNPVPASSLVEIVGGSASSPSAVARAREYVEKIGKTPILVRDSPGFASSRLGVLLGLEAIRMLEEGVADAADIDRAMELGYRHPTGPLRTTDMVGLDVRLGIAEELHAALGDRFAPPALLRRMVEEGRLGRKSGEGFYRWDAP
ncbi:3-hydroxyacyl-CoA dehydrogenase family protein [Microbacterium sp. CIAB417]|uniref:3-hydroxyacyl-CoA dehydrogenase family protein n=1 Tax=Microbacterium sp. CIAB417 TaxID=2860287 RepID=UPI001FADE345|nr:3-hydroxyacyl-CoA dehydrogenase family protein [Microbacterium sp. CIAB417]